MQLLFILDIEESICSDGGVGTDDVCANPDSSVGADDAGAYPDGGVGAYPDGGVDVDADTSPQTIGAPTTRTRRLFVVVPRSNVDSCPNGWSHAVQYVAVLHFDVKIIAKVQPNKFKT